MLRMVQAKQNQSRLSLASPRWAMVGAAVASLVVIAILTLAVFQTGFFPDLSPKPEGMLVAQRPGFAVEKTVVVKKGPTAPSEKGPRRGPVVFSQIMFQFQEQDSPTVQAIDILDPPAEILALTSADNYRLLLEPADERHVYVYQLTSSGELVQHFPNEQVNVAQNPLHKGQVYYLPAEPNCFYLDEHTGIERLYVVASTKPLSELAGSFARYSQESDGADRQVQLSSLLETLETIIEAHPQDVAGWDFVFHNN
jgi:hypothetical protein